MSKLVQKSSPISSVTINPSIFSDQQAPGQPIIRLGGTWRLHAQLEKELRDKILALSAGLRTRDAHIKALEEEVLKARMVSVTKDVELSGCSRQTTRLEARISWLNEQTSMLLSENQTLTLRAQHLESTFLTFNCEREAAAIQETQQRQRIEELVVAKNDLEAECSNLRDLLFAERDASCALRQEIKDHKESVRILTDCRRTKDQQVCNLVKDKDRLIRQLAELKRKMKSGSASSENFPVLSPLRTLKSDDCSVNISPPPDKKLLETSPSIRLAARSPFENSPLSSHSHSNQNGKHSTSTPKKHESSIQTLGTPLLVRTLNSLLEQEREKTEKLVQQVYTLEGKNRELLARFREASKVRQKMERLAKRNLKAAPSLR